MVNPVTILILLYYMYNKKYGLLLLKLLMIVWYARKTRQTEMEKNCVPPTISIEEFCLLSLPVSSPSLTPEIRPIHFILFSHRSESARISPLSHESAPVFSLYV